MAVINWLTKGLLTAAAGSGNMDCGAGVGLCGVLTLESGFGTGNYQVRVFRVAVDGSLGLLCHAIAMR